MLVKHSIQNLMDIIDGLILNLLSKTKAVNQDNLVYGYQYPSFWIVLLETCPKCNLQPVTFEQLFGIALLLVKEVCDCFVEEFYSILPPEEAIASLSLSLGIAEPSKQVIKVLFTVPLTLNFTMEFLALFQ